jgi:hypothetical protein
MSEQLECEAIARAALGEPVKQRGRELFYCCRGQVHTNGDRDPSLKINPQKNAWGCFVCGVTGKNGWSLAAFLAGCDSGDKKAVRAWLVARDLLPKCGQNGKAKSGRGPVVATYVYTDAEGNPVARKLRHEPGAHGREKDFEWEHFNNGNWLSGLGGLKPPLYRHRDIEASDWVVVTEGEKDAEAGARIGLPTTTSGGTGSWRDDHGDMLRNKRAVIIADADKAGRIDAQKRAALLYSKARPVKVLEIPGAKDLAEAIEAGWTRERLLALFEEAADWSPAGGAEVVDSIVAFVRRFVSLTKAQALAVALWVAHTHAFDAADCTPYLSINSPEKQSGKTRLLEVLRTLVAKPWFTGRVTAAVLTRKIDAECPTLLLDESDAAFKSDREYAEALRGVLNTGYRRGGVASCCVGQGANISYKDFSTFCPKAIAGIDKLPDTVADRSIPIRLKRAKRGAVERFRERDAEPEASEIAGRLAAWCETNLERLGKARPEIPPELSDRQADVCEPLLAIADRAAGEWPGASRLALVELCAGAQAADGSVGVKLLADIRRVFNPIDDEEGALPEVDRIASADLAKALGEMEDRPWSQWGKLEKPITQATLASLLETYDIGPKPVRLKDGRRLRGYERVQFEEVWELYLAPSTPVSECETATTRENTVKSCEDAETTGVNEDFQGVNVPYPSTSKCDSVTTRENTGGNVVFHSVTPAPLSRLENAVSPNKDATCHAVTLQNWGEAEKKEAQVAKVEWEA